MAGKVKKKEHDLNFYLAEYQALRDERLDWETEAKKISDFILPGRGVYNLYTRPRKRKLTNKNVVNPVAKEALKVLTSGMQGGITSPSRPWFSLRFSDAQINDHPVLSRWLYDCEQRLYAAISASNFYQIIHSFYTEYAGYGTAPTYIGENDSNAAPFRFELLTFGEYVIGLDHKGLVDKFYRTIFMTAHQMIEKFGEDKIPRDIVRQYKESGNNGQWYTVIEAVRPDKYMDKPFTCVHFLINGGKSTDLWGNGNSKWDKPLSKKGYYEFPYPTARWDTIGSDVYGIGLGAEALPDVMRLQQVEKAFLKATHKTIDPPMNVPARLRGKLNTMPGGENYYANPNEIVTPMMSLRYDFKGAGNAIQRIEQRIRQTFFNDIFLTASRDPNASPMKATEVVVKEQEKMLRMGPVVERLQYEYIKPMIERCFNIMARKGLFEELPPELAQIASSYEITLTSVLAQAQKSIAAGPIQEFMAMVGQAAAIDPTVLDVVNVEESMRQLGEVKGVPKTIIRSKEEVMGIRKKRQEAQEAQQAREAQAMQQQQGGQNQLTASQTAKNYSDAGVNLNEMMPNEGT